MNLLLCIDDTDDLSKSTSTGKISQAIEEALLQCSLARQSAGITRHQLLLDERIAYTSHNSAMCLKLTLVATEPGLWPQLEVQIANVATEVILRQKAADCDPGLCICCPDLLDTAERLTEFGFAGQARVLDKQQAYRLAQECGIYLRELGGDGSGVIGALCGVGLRLSGYDGWFRGKLKPTDLGLTEASVSATELTQRLGWPVLLADSNQAAGGQEQVDLTEGLKSLLWAHRRALAIRPKADGSGLYAVCNKRTLFNSAQSLAQSCADFALDNDEEELVQAENRRTCFNCLYRRWTAEGFCCQKGRL